MVTTVRIVKWASIAVIVGIVLFQHIGVQAGVSGLTRFLRSKRSTWWSAKAKGSFEAEHVCIDMNQLLHGAFRSSSDPSHCMAKIFVGLDNLLKLVTPTKTLVLAFDGPAPFAKLQTQRNRRISTPENCLITPGTDFMNAMEDVMICYVLQRSQRPAFRDLTVFISGAGEPGEGELKIVDWINTHMPSPNDSVVICGSDSDILLQAMTLVDGYSRNISILQSNSDYADAFCNVSALVNELASMTSLIPNGKNSMATSLPPPPSSSSPVAVVARGGGVSGISGKDARAKGAAASKYGRSNNDGENKNDKNDDSDDEAEEAAGDLWENISHLPPIFATVPKSMHYDLVALFIMQGNDYLPKLRGMGMLKALKIYGKVMRMLPANERYLIDLSKGSFNFIALWYLMQEIRGDGYVQLPEQYPTCLQSLHTVLQRRKITELPWNDTQVSPASAEESRSIERKTLWIASTVLMGKEYTSEKCITKQIARNEVARQILIDIDPEEYATMLVVQEKVRRKLKAFREAVIDEATEAGELVPGLLRGEKEIDEGSAATTLTAGDKAVTDATSAGAAEEEMRHLDEVVIEDSEIGTGDLSDNEQEEEGEEGPPRRSGVEAAALDTDFTREIHPSESSFIDSGGDGDEEGADSEEEEEGSKSCVTETEYMKYVRDVDIEDYLRGILWVIQMYVDGVCPDISYTFAGRPPPTPSIIMYYIEKTVLKCLDTAKVPPPPITREGDGGSGFKSARTAAAAEDRVENSNSIVKEVASDLPANSTYKYLLSHWSSEQTGERTIDSLRQARAGKQPHRWALQVLRSKLSVPRSQLKPLSPGATAVCVIPEIGGAVVPKHLRGIWRRMQQSFFRNLPSGSLTATNYAALTQYLKEIWQSKEEDEAEAKNKLQTTSTSTSTSAATASSSTASASPAKKVVAVEATGATKPSSPPSSAHTSAAAQTQDSTLATTTSSSSSTNSTSANTASEVPFSETAETDDWLAAGRRNQRRGLRRARKAKAIVKQREKMATIRVHPFNLISSTSEDAEVEKEGEKGEGDEIGDDENNFEDFSSDGDEFDNEDDNDIGDDDEDEDIPAEDDVESSSSGSSSIADNAAAHVTSAGSTDPLAPLQQQQQEQQQQQQKSPSKDGKGINNKNNNKKGSGSDKLDKFPTVQSTVSKPLGPIFIRDGDSEWIVITRLTGEQLHQPEYLPPYRPYNLRLPLPLPFHTPRRLPEGVRVLRAPETVLNPLRKFMPVSMRGRVATTTTIKVQGTATTTTPRQSQQLQQQDKSGMSSSQDNRDNSSSSNSHSTRRSGKRGSNSDKVSSRNSSSSSSSSYSSASASSTSGGSSGGSSGSRVVSPPGNSKSVRTRAGAGSGGSNDRDRDRDIKNRNSRNMPGAATATASPSDGPFLSSSGSGSTASPVAGGARRPTSPTAGGERGGERGGAGTAAAVAAGGVISQRSNGGSSSPAKISSGDAGHSQKKQKEVVGIAPVKPEQQQQQQQQQGSSKTSSSRKNSNSISNSDSSDNSSSSSSSSIDKKSSSSSASTGSSKRPLESLTGGVAAGAGEEVSSPVHKKVLANTLTTTAAADIPAAMKKEDDYSSSP